MVHVLLVFNIPKILRNKQIFNLFSLYGNIERIVLSREKQLAIITFENEKDKMMAYHYLNNQLLYDSPLKLIPLKYPFILLQKSPILPYLNFLQFLYLNTQTKSLLNENLLFFRRHIPLYLQNLKKIISSSSLFTMLKPRLKPTQVFDFNSFLKPLMDFFVYFDEFSMSLQDPNNQRELLQLISELNTVESLSHLSKFQFLTQKSFDLFALEEIPLELDIMNYRNNQKKCKDGIKSKKINRPNRILYIFNLSSCLGLESIKDMFEGFEKVKKFFYLNESKNSALFYFEDVQAACHILCAFKNMKLIEK